MSSIGASPAMTTCPKAPSRLAHWKSPRPALALDLDGPTQSVEVSELPLNGCLTGRRRRGPAVLADLDPQRIPRRIAPAPGRPRR